MLNGAKCLDMKLVLSAAKSKTPFSKMRGFSKQFGPVSVRFLLIPVSWGESRRMGSGEALGVTVSRMTAAIVVSVGWTQTLLHI